MSASTTSTGARHDADLHGKDGNEGSTLARTPRRPCVRSAAADAPTEFPPHDLFVDVDPCTGLDHTVDITGTFFRHSHAGGNTYHADRTITTSSGYVGHGVEVSVEHERIVVINDVLAKPNGDRIRAHVVIVRDREWNARVETFRLECIGRNHG